MTSQKRINRLTILHIEEIYIDTELYPRNGTYWGDVLRYSEAMKSGSEFPPITVARYKNKYYLVDGRHRMEALQRIKETSVSATILTGLSKAQIYAEAIVSNTNHGKNLSSQDRARAITQLKKYGFSIAKISQLVRIPIDKIEPFTAKRITRSESGQKVFLKAPLHHLNKFIVSDDLDENQKSFNNPGQIYLLNQTTKLFTTGYINIEDPKVEEAVENLVRAIQQTMVVEL